MQVSGAIRRMMEIRPLRTAVESLVLGIVMFGYASLFIPADHWRWSEGAKTRAVNEIISPLIQAANANDVGKLDHLLLNGADVNASDIDGVTALISAASNLKHEAAEFLIAHGANTSKVTNQGFSAYYFAHNQNDEELARLLAKGAN